MINGNPKKKNHRVAFIGMKGLPPDLPGAGGGERETEAKTRRLAARGYDVTVYGRNSYNPDTPSEYEGVKLVWLPAPVKRAGMETMLHSFLATLHVILSNRADVISYLGMGNGLFIPLAKLSGKKTYIALDGVDWERPKWGGIAQIMLKLGAASAFRWADEISVDNDYSRKIFAEMFNNGSARLITQGADIWELQGTDKLAPLGLEPENYILFVGMLRPDKGVHLLVEAYSGLDTDIPLVIIGENPDDPEYVQSLKDKSDERVKFLGYRYGAEAKQLFANCLIYVQPSIMEGNSPALMSAMACRRCVVVNGIDQNQETVGDAGVIARSGDTEDLRNKLDELLQNQDRIKELGDLARSRVETVYSWDFVVDEIERVYEELELQKIRGDHYKSYNKKFNGG